MMCIKVDLPEPEGPMMAENWLFSMLKLTPLKALTSMSPRRYVFSSPLTSIMFIVILGVLLNYNTYNMFNVPLLFKSS